MTHDALLREGYRRVRPADLAVRHHLLLGCGAAAQAATQARVRGLRPVPAGRRHRRPARRPRPSSATASQSASSTAFERRLPHRADRARQRRPGAGGHRAHGDHLRHRAGVLRPVLRRDGDGPDRHLLRDLGGPVRLHGGLGRGHRGDDAAGARADQPGGQGAGPVARPGLPADQLPARRRRGPRPRPGLPAAGGSASASASISRCAGRRRSGRPSWRTRSSATGRCTPSPTPGSRCCRRARPAASAPPGCSTRGSWTGSRPRDYDVFSARARVPTWRKAATAARIMVAGPPAPRRAELDRTRKHPCHFGRAV